MFGMNEAIKEYIEPSPPICPLIIDLWIIPNKTILIIKSLKQCSCAHIVYILKNFLISKFEENTEIFIHYFKKNQMNGKMFLNMKRSEFAADIIKFNNGNKKIHGAATKLYKALKEFDFKQLKIDNDIDDTLNDIQRQLNQNKVFYIDPPKKCQPEHIDCFKLRTFAYFGYVFIKKSLFLLKEFFDFKV